MTASAIQLAVLILQGVQVTFLLLHDWVPLGRLSNLKAVRDLDPPGKRVRVTVLSALPFLLVLGASAAYGPGSRWPGWLRAWLGYTYGAALVGAVLAWWGPYLLWQSPERARRYRARFAGTPRFLPERHGIAPDTLHIAFHLCILATLALLACL